MSGRGRRGRSSSETTNIMPQPDQSLFVKLTSRKAVGYLLKKNGFLDKHVPRFGQFGRTVGHMEWTAWRGNAGQQWEVQTNSKAICFSQPIDRTMMFKSCQAAVSRDKNHRGTPRVNQQNWPNCTHSSLAQMHICENGSVTEPLFSSEEAFPVVPIVPHKPPAHQ